MNTNISIHMTQKTAQNFLFLAFGIALLMGFVSATACYADENELFFVAQKAFEDGFHDVAIRYITQLLEQYPTTTKNIKAQLLLGQCYFFKKQYLKAHEIFQSLLPNNEFKDATLFWLAETYFKASDYKQARKYYQQLVEIFGDSAYLPQAYYSLAWTYFEETDYKNAKIYFNKFLKKFPTHQLTEDAAFKIGESEYNLGNPAIASQYFRNYIIRFPDSTRHAKAYFYIAEAHYFLEDYPAAITYYAKVTDIAYDQKLILMAKISMGWSYLKLGKYDLSQKQFEGAQQYSQDHHIPADEIFLGLANLYTKKEMYTNAYEAYDKLITEFPQSPRLAEAHLGMANIDYILERYDQAIDGYKEIIKTYGHDMARSEILEKAYYGLAWTHLKIGDVDSAIINFEAIINKTDNDIVKVSALTQIGDAYQDAEKLDQAIEIYDRILKDYPDSIYTDYVQFREGIALLKLEKIEAAMLSFQSLQANFPGSKYLNEVNYYLGIAYYKKEEWTQTIHFLNKYLNGHPKKQEFLPEVYHILSLANFYTQDYNNALSLFQKVTEDYPGNSIVESSQYYIAECHYHLGHINAAIEKFKYVTEKYAESKIAQDSLLWLGDYYLEHADFKQALSFYNDFLNKYPGSEKVYLVHYEMGQAYQAQGHYDLALNHYKIITPDNDSEIYAKAQMAVGDIFSEQTDSQIALQTYYDIVEKSPEYQRDAYLKIARVYENANDYDHAFDIYEKALATPKALSSITDAELQFHLGDLHELVNNTSKAVETYLKIPYLYPKETSWIIKSYLRSARIFENKAQWDEAKITYQKILNYNTAESKHARERLDWIKENVTTE